MKLFHRALILLLALLVTACPRVPSLLSPSGTGNGSMQAASQTAPITGIVDFGAQRQAQATIPEIAKGATISLIEVSTGYTVATTLTTPTGGFTLRFANGWKPDPNTIYYLEAIKGLKAGSTVPNRVGADLARIRTLVLFDGSMWRHLGIGETVAINPTTTALSIIVSLRSMTPPGANRVIDPKTLIGTIGTTPGTDTTPSPFSNPNSGLIPDAMVLSTYLLVNQALAQDSDPFRNIALDTTDPLFDTLFNAPRIVSVATLTPSIQSVGLNLDVIGSGFSATASENVVEFSDVAGGPIPATVVGVSADLARLTVTVPSGAVTGPIAVTVGGRKIIGPRFYLALQSGHEAIVSDDLNPYNGSLFVANETFGTIARITPQGQITTFFPPPGSALPLLQAPRALTIRNGKIYVTCAGSKKGVAVIDMAAPATAPADFGTGGTIADPRGIAFDTSGRAFVSDGSGQIYRIDSSTSLPVALALTGDPLNSPRGIAFGLDGLYVANSGANNVVKIDPGTGVSAVFKQGFSFPWGVAFDSVGNMYVTNNKGNSVYRWDKATDALAPYATMPSPGGVVADRAGYIYAVDNTSNNLYRITPLGDSSIFASGVSSPAGIAKVGNTLYVLSSTNNSLMTIDPTTSAVGTLARGFNNPQGLAYDGDRDCFYVGSVGNGALSKVDRTTGSTTTLLTGLSSQAVGITYRGGRVYVRSGGSVRAYDVTNFAAPPITYTSVMTSNQGISKDTSTSLNTGSYYIATGGGRRILRVIGDGAAYNSANGNNRVVVFKENDANLTNPRDVAVDGSGNIWVINQVNGAGSLLAYQPDGTLLFGPITDGINNPYGINFDGSKIWVANYDAKTVTSYRVDTGARVDSLPTGSNNPRNLCFYSGDMYLVTNAGVGKIASYASAPAYSLIYTATGAGYSDIEVKTGGTIYVASGGTRKILSDLSADYFDYPNYDSPSFFWQDTGGQFWFTDSRRFTNQSTGGYGYRLIGSAASPGGGMYLAGVDSNGNVYLNGNSACNHDVVGRIKAGPPQEEWTYDSNYSCDYARVGSFSADEQGNFYFTDYKGLAIRKVDATGAVGAISGTGIGREYTTKGSWIEPDGSVLYQSVTSHHRIDKVTITGGSGTRNTQPYGLSAAEM